MSFSSWYKERKESWRKSYVKRKLRLRGGRKYKQEFYSEKLIYSLDGYPESSDISDHLSTIFYHTLEAKPKLIIELGTRGGESTKALLAAAEIANCKVVSIDIEDCSNVKVKYQDRWKFIKDDDVEFGKSKFTEWCRKNNLPEKADVIFIDTSHNYEHTVEEIDVWKNHLTEEGTLMFHDTNMGDGVYSRLDGSVKSGWNNGRGVIKGVEEFIKADYNESGFFADYRNEFLVRHYPYCNGFTVLKRIKF